MSLLVLGVEGYRKNLLDETIPMVGRKVWLTEFGIYHSLDRVGDFHLIT